MFLFAGAAPTLAAAVNVSAFDLGNTAGPWVGGQAIEVTGSYLAPAVASVGLVALALVATAWSRRLDRRAAHAARTAVVSAVPVEARRRMRRLPGLTGVTSG